MTKPTPDASFNLHVVDAFFTVEVCRQLITELRRASSRPALTYGKGEFGSTDGQVRRTLQLVPSANTIQLVARRLSEYRQCLEQHFGVRLDGNEEPQFLCYRLGDFFVAHQDGNTGLVQLKSDAWRRISVTIFLNQESATPGAETYSGGSLVFSDWRTDARLTVAGEAGKLVAFPSETTHEVEPVTHGERYSIVTWYG